MTRVVYLIETTNAGWDQPYRIGDKREMGADAWVPKADMDRLREALTQIDALDPERLIDSCSQLAMRGLVLRMGEIARAALAALPDADDEGEG